MDREHVKGAAGKVKGASKGTAGKVRDKRSRKAKENPTSQKAYPRTVTST